MTPKMLYKFRPAAQGAVYLLFACLMLPGPLRSEAAATAEASGMPAQWRSQKLDFTYSGFTALYTCNGLESKVRYILLALGAREDVKVRATGCDPASNEPSKMAWVATEFNSLAPVSDLSATGAVKAAWAQVQIAPNRPSFMGAGECELVEQMRELLQKGFALRNVKYSTTCVPHHVSVADYGVTAEALKAIRNQPH